MKMKTIFVLTACLFSLKTEAQSTCGIPGKPSGLQINATLSERGAWPWIVAVYSITEDKFICGGTLIGSNIVVTAAHCIQNKGEETPRHPREIVLKIGKYDLTQPFERGSVIAYPSDIFVHPNWKYWTSNFDSDIALITLENKVEITDSIFPICLGEKTKSEGTVVGWGKTEQHAANKPTNKPRELNVTIRDNEECFLKNPRFAAISSLNTFCAGKDAFSGPCSGDSGGGLFIKVEARWYLRGIVSASFLENGVCDVSQDAVFTNVLNFLKWINEVASNANAFLPRPPVQQISYNKVQKTKKEVFCFFESWAEGREGDGSFSLYDFKPELCTTAVYMLALLEGDQLVPNNPWLELPDDGGQNLYARFNGLKTTHPHLRTLMAIGGWVEGSVKYSQLASNSFRRKNFARNSAEFLKKHGFDGLHFHWEHPAHRGGAPEDKQNFVHLLKEIHDVYKPQNLYVSAFLRTQKADVEKAYDLRNIAKFVDAITMMTFDFNGPWNQKVGFPAALRGSGEDNVESRVNFFTQLGVPSRKIIIGIPFFGRNFIANNEGNIGDESADTGFPGPFVKENGFLGYNEICRLRKEREWREVRYDESASQSIGKFEKDGLTHVVTFETPRSVANKVKYAVENDLGGVWGFFVDTDDYLGECKQDSTTFADFPGATSQIRERDFPLLRTINEVLKLYS